MLAQASVAYLVNLLNDAFAKKKTKSKILRRPIICCCNELCVSERGNAIIDWVQVHTGTARTAANGRHSGGAASDHATIESASRTGERSSHILDISASEMNWELSKLLGHFSLFIKVVLASERESKAVYFSLQSTLVWTREAMHLLCRYAHSRASRRSHGH